MLLCGVVRTALSISIGAIVQLMFFILPNPNLTKVQGSMPPGAEDEIVLIEHLPGRRVHLQDFFWTGAEDAPAWLDPEQGLTFYETKPNRPATINPSILKGNPPQSFDETSMDLDPNFVFNEEEQQDVGILIGDDPGPRYWLLTVLRAGEAVPPKIELRLARLYKAAFSRQQERHLGLVSMDPRARRATDKLFNINHLNFVAQEINHTISDENKDIKIINKKVKRTLKDSNDEEIPQDGMDEVKHSKLRSLDRLMKNTVQVKMHNTSTDKAGATRLVYSVHLGGQPVPAETAARDMSLISPQEVALELGAPVIVQSEPFLKETQPLALSRKRDTWLLIGGIGSAVILLAFIAAGLTLFAKRKKAQSTVAVPPNRSILRKEREYITSTPGIENVGFSISETEVKTDGTSQGQTLASLSRTPVTPGSQESLDAEIHEILSDDEHEARKQIRNSSCIWEEQEQHTGGNSRRMVRTNNVEVPGSPDSTDTVISRTEQLESPKSPGYFQGKESNTASPHSYLSMPSCKRFPSMKSVEPLSKVLEPVMVRHLDIDSPEMNRRENGENGHAIGYDMDNKFLVRSSSARKDPGVLGPIVWDLKRQRLIEGQNKSETSTHAGPVGRARRRLHELLEDSFSLFGSRDQRNKETFSSGPTSVTSTSNALGVMPDIKGKSANVSPVGTPSSIIKTRPRTSVPRKEVDIETLDPNYCERIRSRGAWGSRPLSAGPFHRPNFPEVDPKRILVDTHLLQQDPAVPLIANIKQELQKFSSK